MRAEVRSRSRPGSVLTRSPKNSRPSKPAWRFSRSGCALFSATADDRAPSRAEHECRAAGLSLPEERVLAICAIEFSLDFPIQLRIIKLRRRFLAPVFEPADPS